MRSEAARYFGGLVDAESVLAGMKSPPDMIVCANDDMELGALEALN
jgi:DNA-binding LacI/PurR family transcriptional regulator